VPGARIVEQTLLDDYDSYYYSRRRQTALPVLRVKFDDPMRTWVYVDTHTSSIVAQIHKYSRIERWLYNGLHSFDLPFLYVRRPLWDIVVLVLSAGGIALTITTMLPAWRRLRRHLGRA